MRKALIVGINDYLGTLSPLKGCLNDASAMHAVLEKNGDDSPNFSIRDLLDVTKKAELKKAIVELFSGSGDIALFYYSGHGFVNDINGYLVTPDACSYDEGLPMSELMNIVRNSKFKNNVIILDCCFSGTLGNTGGTVFPSSEIVMGTTILTASTAEECSIEIDGHGVFTNLLVQALQGGAADFTGNITPGGIYAFVDQSLGPWYPRPMFKTNVQEFVSLRKVTPQVPVDVIRLLTTYFEKPDDIFHLTPLLNTLILQKKNMKSFSLMPPRQMLQFFRAFKKCKALVWSFPLMLHICILLQCSQNPVALRPWEFTIGI